MTPTRPRARRIPGPVPEDHERRSGRDPDGHERGEDRERVPARRPLVDHHGRNRPGACEKRDAQRNDRHFIAPGQRVGPVGLPEPGAGQFSVQHLEGDPEEEDPARDLEGAKGEPEREEQESPGDGKDGQDRPQDHHRASEDDLAVGRREPLGQRDEERQGPDRVDNREDADDDRDEEAGLGVHRSAGPIRAGL